MTVVVYLIGALLVIAGAVSIDQGVPIVRLELGWTEIIGGAVAASAGFVILAIGVVLTRLRSMERALRGLGMATALRGVMEEPADEVAPLAAPVTDEIVRPFAPHPLAPPPPPPERVAERRAPVYAPMHDEREPPVQRATDLDVEPEPPLAEAPLHLSAPVLDEEPRDLELNDGAPALAAIEDHAPAVPPVEPLVPPVFLDEAASPAFPPAPEPPRGRPNFLASFLARRNAAVERAASRLDEPPSEPRFALPPEPEASPAPRTSVDISSGWDEPAPGEPAPPALPHPLRGGRHPSDEWEHAAADAGPAAPETHEPLAAAADHAEPLHEEPAHEDAVEPEEEPSHVAPDPPAEPDPAMPVVVGRYNAGSASYVMYSNGMIEVETDSGTHQFASMQELKSFIERRDAARV